MGSKLPWRKFHFRDWIVDIQTLSCAEEGAWLRVVCQMWLNDVSELSFSFEGLAILWGMPEWGQAQAMIETLSRKGICDVVVQNENVRNSKADVRVVCRRLKNEEIERKHNIKYQHDFRVRKMSGQSKPLESEVRSQKSEKEVTPTPKGVSVAPPAFMEPIGQEKLSQVSDLVAAALHPGQRKQKPVRWVSDPVRKLLICFKAMQEERDVKDEVLTRVYVKHFANDAEDLIDLFHDDYKVAVQCLSELGGEFRAKGLTWTLATIIRHAGEWKVKHATHEPARNT